MSDVPPGLASLVLKEKTKKSFNVLSVVFFDFFVFSFTEDIGWKLLQQEPGRLCL